MDLDLVMQELMPNENVSPVMSSYNDMVVYWRGIAAPPSLKEVEDQWAIMEAKVQEAQKASDLEIELAKAGAAISDKVNALWEKIMDADSKQADDLKVVVDDIKK